MSHAIETHDLTRRFGSVLAVNAVNLRVPEKSVYGFLGPNGAGKTTTIRMLLGLLRPTGGDVRVFGQSLPEHRSAILAKTGSLVETPSQYPHLTAYENLEVVQRLLRLERPQIDRVLGIVGLQTDAKRPVRQYSLGMKQRLGLAAALLGEPQLLVLDEPTNGLDPAGILEMRTLLQRMPGELGITVFLSSHLLSEVEQMATHIGILNKGALIFEGTLGQLQSLKQERLVIETDDPVRATALLAQHNWSCEKNGSSLTVAVKTREDAAVVNKLLIQNNLRVFRLTPGQASLEDVFLSLTNGEENHG